MAQENDKIQSPGDYIRYELHARGWTQADLAQILGRPLPTVNEIIQGKRAIMPEMAIALGAAFGNDPQMWLEREAAYRLSLAQHDDEPVRQRVRLYEIAPVKEMERRGWIRRTQSANELETELLRFFDINSLDEEPQLTVSARKANSDYPLSTAQRAWCIRARKMAKAMQASAFKSSSLDTCEKELRKLAAFPEESRHVSKILAQHGIRFVIIEPLLGSKIDGAAFWLSQNSPAIAISVRYDRIDAFWFTLMHEFAHIRNQDSFSMDTDLAGDSQMPSIAKSDQERRADEQAASSLIPPDKLRSFILRVGPLYSKSRINQFAQRVQIHPGIVVGQLQYRGEIGYSANREMLAKIREIVISSTITDGWGQTVSTETF